MQPSNQSQQQKTGPEVRAQGGSGAYNQNPGANQKSTYGSPQKDAGDSWQSKTGKPKDESEDEE